MTAQQDKDDERIGFLLDFMASYAKPVVVVAEDDESIGFLLNFMLTREGFDVLMATDGRQAKALIDEIPPPSMVLLDLMLPYADGFEVNAHIRSKPEWSDVPVIMLTGRSQERDIVRAFDAGVCDYIIKPFQPVELIARVRRHLKVKTAA